MTQHRFTMDDASAAETASPQAPAGTFSFGSPSTGAAPFPKFNFSKPATPSKEDSKAAASSADPETFEPDIQVTPLVSLPKVAVETGEENEEVLLDIRAKMFVWGEGNAGLQWKERGVGPLKLLKSKETGLVRLLMRRDKTMKICGNHILDDQMTLENKLGSDRAWAYACLNDFSDHVGEGKVESKSITIALRFKDKTIADNFQSLFEEHRDANAKIEVEEESTDAPADAADDAATAEKEPEPAADAAKDETAEIASKLADTKIES